MSMRHEESTDFNRYQIIQLFRTHVGLVLSLELLFEDLTKETRAAT